VISGCPTAVVKSGKIGLFRLAKEASVSSGCPTAEEKTAQLGLLPQGRGRKESDPSGQVP
jgi:hypothetical protein